MMRSNHKRKLIQFNESKRENQKRYKFAPVDINQIVSRQFTDGATYLISAAKKDAFTFTNLLNHLNPELCDQVALLKNAQGESLFNVIADTYSTNFFIISLFLQKLKPETLQKILLFPEDKIRLSIFLHFQQTSLKLLNSLFDYPETFKKICQDHSLLNFLRIFDGGDSSDAWSDVAKYILTITPPVKKHSSTLQLSHYFDELKMPEKFPYVDMKEFADLKLIRIQGRTLLFENQEQNIIAMKIQKQKERMLDLVKEFKTTTYFHKNASNLGLKSHFPKPKQLSILRNFNAWLNQYVKDPKENENLKKMIGNRKYYGIYLYEIDPKKGDYFTYLHDPTISSMHFQNINRIIIHDLFTLLQNGVIFSQLADLFHNLEHVGDRQDKGRYLVLVNLLRNFYKKGSGRLTNWMESVAYPNLRASGLADLGDRMCVSDLIGKTEKVKEYFSESWEMYKDKTCNYLLANVMAEYQYVLFLIGGRRAVELTKLARSQKKSNEEISTIWQEIAIQMLDNCVQAIRLITHEPYEKIHSDLSVVIDVKRLARQMHYWMTSDYIVDIKQNQVRDDIYAKDTQLEVNFKNFRKNTFNNVLGCSIDGKNPDLGPVNGQEPIKEENKLIYWMINYIFHFYNNFRVTLEDVHRIIAEKDLVQSLQLQKQAFSYLTEQKQHYLNAVIYQERSKSSVLSHLQKSEFTEKAKDHQRQHAAWVISKFWKKHKIKHNEITLENKHQLK